MHTLLYEIRDLVYRLIETMRPIIDFDLSVVDENLLRIAGTGTYKQYVGLNLPKSSATAHVIRTGEVVRIYHPTQEDVCQSCSVQNICLHEVSIIYPINKDGKVIGAISLGSFNETLKGKLLSMEQELISFLKNLSELISSKVAEMEKEKQMSAIINAVDEGIILSDRTGIIRIVNHTLAHLGITQGSHVQDYFPKYAVDRVIHHQEQFDGLECILHLHNRDLPYLLTTKFVDVHNPHSDILFLLKEYKAFEPIGDQTVHPTVHLDRIIGRSKAIEESKAIAISAARSQSNVLILGESGTGKELFARAIHQMSDRSHGPFVAVNCAAIPDNLLESELFGYEDGAFTGAKKGGKLGKFELANGGTIFLDEIGDLSLHLQPKLLRAIEYGHIERIGSLKPIQLNVRIIAATNRNLEQMIADGEFREDLYYRLNVIQLPIPPLRKRREDIPLLAHSLLHKYNQQLGKRIEGFDDEVMQLMLLYSWPGNIRELENTIEYAVHVETSPIIQVTSLPPKVRNSKLSTSMQSEVYNLKLTEMAMIKSLLHQYGDDLQGKKEVAKRLGISLSTLYRRIKEM